MRKLQIDTHILLRTAGKKDVRLIREFILGLAEYEHLADQVSVTEEGLRESLFKKKAAEVIICEYDGAPAGFALFFHNFSTFLGKPGIYLEDLFVKPEFRGKGLGKHLLGFLAKLAVERGCGRFEWACLDWNEPSIKFYKSRGAVPQSGWTTYRVSGEALLKLAGSPERAGSKSGK
jgi:GNAT superfamily N-acetyltransferase